MADFLALLNSKVFKGLTLENSFKLAMEWKAEDWEESGLTNSKFKILINSMKFWSNKLKDGFTECNVIVALYSETDGKGYTAIDMVDSIMEQFPEIEVTSYNYFRNRRYVGIDFQNKEMKNFVINNWKQVETHNVVFLTWALETKAICVRAHWLPKEKGEQVLLDKLNCYMKVTEIKRETNTHKNGKMLGNGIVKFFGKLKDKILLTSIPHIVYIGSLEVLLVCDGREPLCLRCDKLGHRAVDCNMIYCGKCNKLTKKDHDCDKDIMKQKTYAEAAKTDTQIQSVELEELSNWDDQLETVTPEEIANSARLTLMIVQEKTQRESTQHVSGSQQDTSLAKTTNTPHKKNNKPQAIQKTENMQVDLPLLKRKMEEKNSEQTYSSQETMGSSTSANKSRMLTRGLVKAQGNLSEGQEDEGGGNY